MIFVWRSLWDFPQLRPYTCQFQSALNVVVRLHHKDPAQSRALHPDAQSHRLIHQLTNVRLPIHANENYMYVSIKAMLGVIASCHCLV